MGVGIAIAFDGLDIDEIDPQLRTRLESDGHSIVSDKRKAQAVVMGASEIDSSMVRAISKLSDQGKAVAVFMKEGLTAYKAGALTALYDAGAIYVRGRPDASAILKTAGWLAQRISQK